MKLEIYDEPKEVSEPVRLKLVRNRDRITVVAVDHNGERIFQGDLITFIPSGRIIRHTCINKTIGFDLDISDKIKEVS